MKYSKKIAGLGVAILTAASVAIVSPASAATPLSDTLQLATQQNDAVDVSTELNCNYHMLTAKVTNTTDSTITPKVTFDLQTPAYDNPTPLNPGQTRSYSYNFSGNNVVTDVEVSVDTFNPVKLSPTLSCQEPVTFTASSTSSSAITGMLRNNSTMVGQTVLTRVGSGNVHVENLNPGESRLVAIPFTGYNDQQSASVSIGTTAGYQSMYTVDLDNSPIIPLKQ